MERKQQGQTSVEYLLLIVMVSFLVSSIYPRLKARLLSDDGTCTGPGAATSIVCIANSLWTNGSFRYFRVLR